VTGIGWCAVVLSAVCVIATGGWMITVAEMHHRTGQLAKIVQPQKIISLDWPTLMMAVVALIQPPPPADMTGLTQAVEDFMTLIPTE
jgi:uncharacterized membrane protein